MEVLTRAGPVRNAPLDRGLNLGQEYGVERKVLDPDTPFAKGPDQELNLARGEVPGANIQRAARAVQRQVFGMIPPGNLEDPLELGPKRQLGLIDSQLELIRGELGAE